MINEWMDVLREDKAADAEVDKLAALMEGMTFGQLCALQKKTASCHREDVGEELQKYVGTPLFDQAAELVQQKLQATQAAEQLSNQLYGPDAAKEQMREQEKALRAQKEQIELQQAILDIQLMKLQNDEATGASAAAPVEAMPAEVPAEQPAPAPAEEVAVKAARYNQALQRAKTAGDHVAVIRLLDAMQKEAISLTGLAGGLGKGVGYLTGAAKGVGSAFKNVGTGIGQLASRGANVVKDTARAGATGASNIGGAFRAGMAGTSAATQKAIGGGKQLLGTTPGFGPLPAPSPVPNFGRAGVPIPSPGPAARPALTAPAPRGSVLPAVATGATVIPFAAAQQKAAALRDADAMGRAFAKTALQIPLGTALGNLARRNTGALIGAGVGAAGGAVAGGTGQNGSLTGALGGAVGGAALGAAAGKGVQVANRARMLAKAAPGASTGNLLAQAHNVEKVRDFGAFGAKPTAEGLLQVGGGGYGIPERMIGQA